MHSLDSRYFNENFLNACFFVICSLVCIQDIFTRNFSTHDFGVICYKEKYPLQDLVEFELSNENSLAGLSRISAAGTLGYMNRGSLRQSKGEGGIVSNWSVFRILVWCVLFFRLSRRVSAKRRSVAWLWMCMRTRAPTSSRTAVTRPWTMRFSASWSLITTSSSQHTRFVSCREDSPDREHLFRAT